MFFSYCCTANYQKFSSLKQHTCICNFTVSLGQEYGHCLGFTAQPFTSCSYRLHCASSRGSGNHFQVHSGCWQNSLPQDGMTEDPSSLLAASWRLPTGSGSCPQDLMVSTALLCGLLQHVHSFPPDHRRVSHCSLLSQSPIELNITVSVTSNHSCHSLLAGSQSQVMPLLKGGGSTKAETLEGGAMKFILGPDTQNFPVTLQIFK